MLFNKTTGSILVFFFAVFFVMTVLTASVFALESQGSIADAKFIDTNMPYTDNLPTSNTVNYYRIDLNQDGYISIDFEHDNFTYSYTGWRIWLLGEDSSVFDSFTSRWDQIKASSPSIGLPAGTYYVKVEAASSIRHHDGDYVLTVNYTASDYWEKEPNDTILTATAIEVNSYYNGSVNHSSDVDFFKFELNQDGFVSIDFEHDNLTESYTGWRIILLGEDSMEFERFNSRWNQPVANSSNIGLPAGTYYVKVEAASSVRHHSADYKMKVNFTASDYWEKEPNDTFLTATPITVNRAYKGCINTSSDKDYFSFELASAGSISIDFEHVMIEGNYNGWRISLIDTQSSQLLSFTSQWNEPLVSSEEILLESGTYYILVEAASSVRHHNADYSLTVEAPHVVTPPDPIQSEVALYWQNKVTGLRYVYFYDGTSTDPVRMGGIGQLDPRWDLVGVGDLDGDGKTDVLWNNTISGLLYAWLMDDLTVINMIGLGTETNTDWKAVALGDMNGNGSLDVIWENSQNLSLAAWFLDGTDIIGFGHLPGLDPGWTLVDAADMNGNGYTDLILQNTVAGEREVWLMEGLDKIFTQPIGIDHAQQWQLSAVGDFNGNGHADLIWTNNFTGLRYVEFMENLIPISGSGVGIIEDLNWEIVGVR